MTEMVFVFGSNESGIHGDGAAKFAYKKKGARWGFSYGRTGQSFAIPTKAQGITHTLELDQINNYVRGFLAYAQGHPEMTFQVTCIGCGLAGLTHKDIAPMFKDAPSNCLFDDLWKPHLGDDHQYWGTI